VAPERSNITVETAHVPGTGGPTSAGTGDCVIIATSNSSVPLSLVVITQAFWGAAADIAASADGKKITMASGDLGTVTVSVSGGTLDLNLPDARSQAAAAPVSITAA